MVSAVTLLVVGMMQLVLAVFVNVDAHKRGSSEWFYTGLVLFTGIFGILVYLLSRPDEKIPREQRR